MRTKKKKKKIFGQVNIFAVNLTSVCTPKICACCFCAFLSKTCITTLYFYHFFLFTAIHIIHL